MCPPCSQHKRESSYILGAPVYIFGVQNEWHGAQLFNCKAMVMSAYTQRHLCKHACARTNTDTDEDWKDLFADIQAIDANTQAMACAMAKAM